MPTTMVPASKPKLMQSDAEKLIAKFNLGEYPVRLLGIRGYYKHTMGNNLSSNL